MDHEEPFEDEDGDEPMPEVVPVGAYQSIADAHEHGLVILSRSLPYWLLRTSGGYQLFVPHDVSEFVAADLEDYDAISEGWEVSSEPVAIPKYSPNVGAAIIYGLLLICAYVWQTRSPDWVDQLCNSSIGIYEAGEVWRALGALFLHGGADHLFGNVISGAILGLLVATGFGASFGWACILVSGVMGNLLSSWFHYPDPYTSIGASTAVFGALGILVGHGLAWVISLGMPDMRGWFRKASPLVAGLVILGWFGTGGERTDVLAHVCGFGCGIPLGVLGYFWRGRLADQSKSP